VRALTGIRMDVAAFVGVAPRGPARLPAYVADWATPPRGPVNPLLPLRSVAVAVESWSAYRRLYGGFEGPGLLPYAVGAFFEQGGTRAYIVRVVHDYGESDPENEWATASGTVTGARPKHGGAIGLRARNEGSWGNHLRATLSFSTRPLAWRSGTGTTEIVLDADAALPAGTLVRFWSGDGIPDFRFVTQTFEEWTPEAPVRVLRATLEAPLYFTPERGEIVEAALSVSDTSDPTLERSELHEGLGLSALHPRWMAAALYRDSALVYPDAAWIADDLVPDDVFLRPSSLVGSPPADAEAPSQFCCGRDRYAEIVPDDCFDPAWVLGDEEPRGGVHALVECEDLSIVVVPDLYSPEPLVEVDDEEVISLAGAEFELCIDPPPVPAPAPVDPSCPGSPPLGDDGSTQELDGLRLVPAIPTDLDAIAALQQKLVDLAELLEQWVVLLDVPPGLNQRQILQWRARFGSAYAAAYHPWLRVSRPDDAREPLVKVNPAAYAAGIVAKQEIAFGVQHGPANLIAIGPVSPADAVSPGRHDELHQNAVNVYIRERDGLRLTAGRTLSRDPQWRQLSVRRLITMLRRALLRQMQWTVFEPNDARLRDELRRMLEAYLRQLFLASAFRGNSPSEAYFVRCDDALNPPEVLDEGKLICHVGVAPAEPLEFIVLRFAREGDGTLLMEN
jgi:hypothetical protein